jgi:hypothetical protein
LLLSITDPIIFKQKFSVKDFLRTVDLIKEIRLMIFDWETERKRPSFLPPLERERLLSAFAEDHGLWPWMNVKRITLRSLVRRRVCFGGFRRRTWRYHGLCPWGSIALRDIDDYINV